MTGERGVAVVSNARPSTSWVQGEAYRRVFRTLRAMVILGPGQHTLAAVSGLLPNISKPVLSRILAVGSEPEFFIDRHARGVYELEQRGLLFGTGRDADARGVSRNARSALETLQHATGSIVQLHAVYTLSVPMRQCAATFTGGDLLADDLVERHATVGYGPQPLALGAAGHAMLASMPPYAADQILANSPRSTFAGLWSEPLAEELERINERGYARTVSPDGWETVAAPMISAAMVVGALSLTYSAEASDEQRSAQARALQSSAPFIQALLDEVGRPALVSA